MKKLYMVKIEYDVFVLAEDENKAEQVAIDKGPGDYGDNPHSASYGVREIDPSRPRLLTSDLDTYPWGDDKNDMNVREVLEELKKQKGS